jgi:transmembrane sensor
MNTQSDIQVVIDYLEDPENEQHKQSLDEWLQMDAGHLDIFLEMRALWQGDLLPAISSYDTDQQWEQLEAQLDAPQPVQTPAKPVIVKKMTTKYWWAAAAVLLLGVGYTLFFPSAYQIKRTAQQQDSLLLPDGSMVYLNAHTTIKYPRNFNTRNIIIEKGEAFFEVAQQPDAPFTVSTDKVAIQVLGTSFNVKEDAQAVKVFVASGKVSAAFKGSDNKVTLTQGVEAALANEDRKIETRRPQKNNNILAWKTRVLVFDDTPLPAVAAALENLYHVQVVIKNEQLADKKLIASFRNLPLAEVLDIMEKTLQINISLKNDLVEIY